MERNFTTHAFKMRLCSSCPSATFLPENPTRDAVVPSGGGGSGGAGGGGGMRGMVVGFRAGQDAGRGGGG